jgi:protein-disulfide isomerase
MADPKRGRRICFLTLLMAALLFAQDWKTATALSGVDFKGLTPAKKSVALRLLRNQDCTCGCEMKLAECRVKDPSCSYSKGLAAALVDALKEGKSEADAIAAARASKFGQAPEPRKILDDPIAIPTANAPALGPRDAAITLVEFSDFQCPYCFQGAAQLHALLRAYPTQVKLIFKQYPLDIHSQAALAAAASVAAHRQGKFWRLHDAMFEKRQDLSRPSLLALARRVGLDIQRFTADLDSTEVKAVVTRDRQDGDRAGVEGTPSVFINGQHYNGSLELDKIRPVIDGELKKTAKR